MPVDPQHDLRRSPVYPRLQTAGARFVESGDTVIASAYPDTPAPPLGLVDLSPQPRTGIKGPRAWSWLDDQGWPVPDANNTTAATSEGDVVLRLSDRESVVAAQPTGTGEAIERLEAAIPGDGVWHTPRRDSHCAFLLRGDDAVSCLAKVCGIDFRHQHFPEGTIAQTSVARLNSIVCRMPHRATPSFLILADTASAIWFWDNLLDSMDEFGGGPLGVHEIG